MKKYAAILMLLFVTITISAEAISPVISKYKDEKGVEVVDLDSFMMTMFKPVLKAQGMDMDINSLSVITLKKNSASEKTINRFKDDVTAALKKKNMQPVVSVNEDDSNVKIYIDTKDDYISNLVVLVYENNETALVNIKGKIKPEDINGNFKSVLSLGK